MLDTTGKNRPWRRSAFIAHELERLNIDIVAFIDVRFLDTGSLKEATLCTGPANLNRTDANSASTSSRRKRKEVLVRNYVSPKLKDSGGGGDFQQSLRSKLQEDCQENPFPEALWNHIKSVILQSSEEVLDFPKNSNRDCNPQI